MCHIPSKHAEMPLSAWVSLLTWEFMGQKDATRIRLVLLITEMSTTEQGELKNKKELLFRIIYTGIDLTDSTVPVLPCFRF